MKDDIKHTWVEDLRSGEFQQANGVLVGGSEDEVGYCCLGVLTHQFVRTHPDGPLKWSDDGLTLYRRCRDEDQDEVEYSDRDGDWYEFADNDLPEEVAEWAGLDGERGDGERVTVVANGSSHERVEHDMKSNPLINGVTAIYRNDNARETFEQIADAIEQDGTL
jgi:hypothetical protein